MVSRELILRQSFLSLFLFGKERMHSTDQGFFTAKHNKHPMLFIQLMTPSALVYTHSVVPSLSAKGFVESAIRRGVELLGYFPLCQTLRR